MLVSFYCFVLLFFLSCGRVIAKFLEKLACAEFISVWQSVCYYVSIFCCRSYLPANMGLPRCHFAIAP